MQQTIASQTEGIYQLPESDRKLCSRLRFSTVYMFYSGLDIAKGRKLTRILRGSN